MGANLSPDHSWPIPVEDGVGWGMGGVGLAGSRPQGTSLGGAQASGLRVWQVSGGHCMPHPPHLSRWLIIPTGVCRPAGARGPKPQLWPLLGLPAPGWKLQGLVVRPLPGEGCPVLPTPCSWLSGHSQRGEGWNVASPGTLTAPHVGLGDRWQETQTWTRTTP